MIFNSSGGEGKRNKKWGGARHEVALDTGKGPNGETNIPRGVIPLLKTAMDEPKTFLVFVIVGQQKL